MFTEAQIYGGSRLETTGNPILQHTGQRLLVFEPPASGHTVTLPDARRVSKTGGLIFLIHNRSVTDAFDINDGAGSFLVSLAAGAAIKLYLYDRATLAGSWAFDGSRVASTASDFSDNTKPPSFDLTSQTWDEN